MQCDQCDHSGSTPDLTELTYMAGALSDDSGEQRSIVVTLPEDRYGVLALEGEPGTVLTVSWALLLFPCTIQSF